MEGTQLAGAALFIGVFGFLAVGTWAGARAERKAQARYALLTRLASSRSSRRAGARVHAQGRGREGAPQARRRARRTIEPA